MWIFRLFVRIRVYQGLGSWVQNYGFGENFRVGLFLDVKIGNGVWKNIKKGI